MLKGVNHKGKEVGGSEFTLRVGPKRKGQKDIVLAVRLAQKTSDAQAIATLPNVVVTPVETLPEQCQETVVGRSAGKYRGRRFGWWKALDGGRPIERRRLTSVRALRSQTSGDCESGRDRSGEEAASLGFFCLFF